MPSCFLYCGFTQVLLSTVKHALYKHLEWSSSMFVDVYERLILIWICSFTVREHLNYSYFLSYKRANLLTAKERELF